MSEAVKENVTERCEVFYFLQPVVHKIEKAIGLFE